MITPRNSSFRERLLEIASRIHCPDSEGGKYAAQIKSEIEQVANTMPEELPAGIAIQRIQFGERNEPEIGAMIYRLGDTWTSMMPMSKDESGIYLGHSLVLLLEPKGF